jgi:hypothetical protein
LLARGLSMSSDVFFGFESMKFLVMRLALPGALLLFDICSALHSSSVLGFHPSELSVLIFFLKISGRGTLTIRLTAPLEFGISYSYSYF